MFFRKMEKELTNQRNRYTIKGKFKATIKAKKKGSAKVQAIVGKKTSLNISNNKKLECLYCTDNSLTELDLSNGHSHFGSARFYSILFCPHIYW